MANPWYAFYPGDYGRDTAHLSMIEDSAYRRLLDHYYSTGRPIPTHVEQVFRICRAFAPEEQEAVRSVLREFFTEQEDGWHNNRVDREIEKAREIGEKRSKAGRLSAQKRTTARAAYEPTHVEQVFTQPQPQSQPQILSPSSAAGFSFLENKNLDSSDTRARAKQQYTPEDHLEKVLRKISQAQPRLDAIAAEQPHLSGDELDEMLCQWVGITMEKLYEVRELQLKRPERQSA